MPDYVFGSGSSYINWIKENTYGSGTGANGAPNTTCLIRPGSIPAKSQQQIHPTYITGNSFDSATSIRVKNNVEGSYNFYLSDSSIDLIQACNQGAESPPEVSKDVASLAIAHPLSGLQFLYKGMKPNQINISIPGDNALAEGSIAFVGQDLSTTTSITPAPTAEGFFEGWTTQVQRLADDVTGSSFLSIYDFSLNINNNLSVPDTLTNSYKVAEPIEGIREVTGTFTLVLEITSLDNGATPPILDALFTADASTPVPLYVEMYSTSNDVFALEMPSVIIEQGSTPTDISPDYLRYGITFRALYDTDSKADVRVHHLVGE